MYVVPGATVTYDSNGNLTGDGTHTSSWDAEGNPAQIDSVTLTYDAMNRMAEQGRGSSYTQIIYSPFGSKLALVNSQSLVKAFVPLPGGSTAVYTSSGLSYYRHPDWLGSSRVASTPSRTKYFDVGYAPYGESYVQSGTTDLSFTGQNQDTVSGMYDFMLREYNPIHGRWISPDPAGLEVVNYANPQSWNRYSYVVNNPLVLVDPLGLQAPGPQSPKWGCQFFTITSYSEEGTPTDSYNFWCYFQDLSDTSGPCNSMKGPMIASCNDATPPPLRPPKSPARQQCEADATRTYGDQMAANPAIADRAALIAGGIVIGGSGVGGCVIGGATGLAVGGPLGAVGGCFFGGLDAAGLSVPEAFVTVAITQYVTQKVEDYSAKKDLRSALAACEAMFPE